MCRCSSVRMTFGRTFRSGQARRFTIKWAFSRRDGPTGPSFREFWPVLGSIGSTSKNSQLVRSRIAFRACGFPAPLVAVFERRAGYLDVEDCVRGSARLAVEQGAHLQIGECIRSWKAEGSGVAVQTDRGTYSADRLVVSAGAWAGTLLADLGIRLQVVRKSLYWYAAPAELYSPASGFPGFLYETDRGSFYGFPRIDEEGLKAAEHSGGLPVSDPLQVDRNPDPGETLRVEQFLAEYLPGVTPRAATLRHLLIYVEPGRAFRCWPASGILAGGVRRRFVRSRVQVRHRARGSACRPCATRADQSSDRFSLLPPPGFGGPALTTASHA